MAFKGIQKHIAGIFGVTYLEDCSDIARKIRNTVTIKDLTGIIVRNIGVFDFPGMICKLNHVSIECCFEFSCVLDVQILPCEKNLAVFVHTHTSQVNHLTPLYHIICEKNGF